jgi:hypothetical protein
MCFLLVGGYNYVCYAPVHHIDKTQQVKFTNTRQDTISSNASSDKAPEYLIAEEVEDEDTSNAFARKYRLLTRRYLTLPHIFIFSDHCGGFKDRRSGCNLSSYKYLLQGVLRI